MEYLLFSWIYSTCLRNDMSYYFSCKTANTSSIVLVCSVCYCYEIFSYKLPINIHVHIRKKHMIDLIMFYDKKKTPRTVTQEDHFVKDQKDWRKKKRKPIQRLQNRCQLIHRYIFLRKSFTDQIEYKSFFEVNNQAKESIVELSGSKTIQIIISLVCLVKAWGNVILYVRAIDWPSCSEF